MSQSPRKQNLSQTPSQKSLSSQPLDTPSSDEFRILIASDIHLGFAEKDPVRGKRDHHFLMMKISYFK